MYSWYLSQSAERTAKHLGRSVVSVKRKATKMGLNHYLDNLGAKSISRCFDCDVSVVLRWIEKFGLPAKKIVCHNQTRYNIDSKKFWKWAKEHKEIINWSRYELGSLVPEPEWVKDVKKGYKEKNHRKKFSEYEKNRVLSLLHKGKSYREISVEMGRSYYSISHLCRTIHRV